MFYYSGTKSTDFLSWFPCQCLGPGDEGPLYHLKGVYGLALKNKASWFPSNLDEEASFSASVQMEMQGIFIWKREQDYVGRQ